MKKLYEAIDKWLFETSYQKYSTDDKSVKKPEEPVENNLPIMPMDQMATQLSHERPPIEDPEWIPTSSGEIAAASDQLARTVPDDQIEFFYNELQDLRDKAIDQSREKEFNDPVFEDDPIQVPISPKGIKKESRHLSAKLLKRRAASKEKGYIIDVTKNKNGSVMAEYGKWSNARKRDFARKWKQGDELEFERGDTIGSTYDGYRTQDDYDIEDDGEEFIPDVDDIRDFMEETGEDDPTKIPGYKDEMAKEFGLADIVKSNIFPTVSGESGITNKLEREIYPLMRAAKNAPQLVDRLMSLIKSGFGAMTFYEGMLAAKLIDPEHVKELKKDESALLGSEMYKYVISQTIIIPAMKQLEKLRKAGVYDPLDKKSQISPEEADAIIEKIRTRWNGMTKARKANDAKKGMQADLEFLSRDTSVMG